MMDDDPTDQIAASLVREYVISKNLRTTLTCFDEENPINSETITSRLRLAKVLHIEREQKPKSTSILEIIVRRCLTDKTLTCDGPKGNSRSSCSRMRDDKLGPVVEKNFRLSPIKLPEHKKKLNDGESFMDLSITPEVNTVFKNKPDSRSTNTFTHPPPLNLNVTKSWNSTKSCKRNSKATDFNLKCEDLTLDDFDELDIESTYSVNAKISSSTYQKQFGGEQISRASASDLKTILLGPTKSNFNREWKQQHFIFNPNLPYGLIQQQGGPCGVVACLQGYVIRELLFPQNKKPIGLNPNKYEQDVVLKMAICNILWKIGQFNKATVAIFNTRCKHSPTSSCTKGPESLIVYHFSTFQNLEMCITNNLNSFKHEHGSGCISLLYSAVLTRGIENIRYDMDEYNGHLMGAHGYCTQEMVNLLLTGKATSNVFDGEIQLDSGGGEISLLRGISKQSEIGYLSLFEHYNSCKVGCFMKDPLYPIWVVCSESHFTVLFGTNILLTSEEKPKSKSFFLIYYDCLANQDSEIKLVIAPTSNSTKCSQHDDLIPPLEHCIRTKWPGVSIEWQGCEPLL